ncbi:type II toxin-antitoxin system RelE/ParE family toxin [Nitrosomonas sp.]|uniref:type II toxin-antitoxin system RelE/ParE family toxin n=1 Tax=Nitrosomonas sp. TaxID=42353 RepID=UPI0037C747F8
MAKPKGPYRIVWRPVAKADLDNIVDYIAEDSSIRAGQFSQELRDKIKPLEFSYTIFDYSCARV